MGAGRGTRARRARPPSAPTRAPKAQTRAPEASARDAPGSTPVGRRILESATSAAATGVGYAVVAALVLCPFVFLGVVNGDEGWYTVSSRLAARGLLPYRDFAFTQGPVFLYLLAPFERLFPGLVTARTISAICAAVGIGLILVVADRLAGRRAVLFSAAVLVAATPSLPYWLALTKTYGLASLFLSATLYALTSPAAPSRRLPIAVACAFGFAFTRPSAALFALIVLVVAVWCAPNIRTRITITGVAIVASLPFLALIALAPNAAIWGLVQYHDLSGGPPDNLWTKLFVRTFDVMRAWPGPSLVVLLAVIALARSKRIRGLVRGRPEMIAVVAGLGSFLVLHELGVWFWAEEYVVPVLPSVVVLAVATLVVYADELALTSAPRLRSRFRGRRERTKWAYQQRPSKRSARAANVATGDANVIEKWHVTVALAVCICVTLVTGGHTGYIGMPGWNGAPGADAMLARCIAQNSKPSDQVLALYYADLITEADRNPVDRASMGIFSYQDVSASRAQELHILDMSALLDLLTKERPKVLVLSQFDTAILTLAGYFSSRPADLNTYSKAIDDNYRIVCHEVLSRQVPNAAMQVAVLVRK